MSGTLSARVKPKSKWPWEFKMTVRDKLSNRFTDGVIRPSDVDYLIGLRDGVGDKDAHTLDNMIDALHDGSEIEFKVEY